MNAPDLYFEEVMELEQDLDNDLETDSLLFDSKEVNIFSLLYVLTKCNWLADSFVNEKTKNN